MDRAKDPARLSGMIYVCEQCNGTGYLPTGQRCPCREEDDDAAARRQKMMLVKKEQDNGPNV